MAEHSAALVSWTWSIRTLQTPILPLLLYLKSENIENPCNKVAEPLSPEQAKLQHVSFSLSFKTRVLRSSFRPSGPHPVTLPRQYLDAFQLVHL